MQTTSTPLSPPGPSPPERRVADRTNPDLRIAVLGNVDSGKSTLVGVLSKFLLDDGRGLARSTTMLDATVDVGDDMSNDVFDEGGCDDDEGRPSWSVTIESVSSNKIRKK